MSHFKATVDGTKPKKNSKIV